MNLLEVKKQLLSCPGDIIKETIDELGMSQAELAERMGCPLPILKQLIPGKAPITQESASKLEDVLGIAANFWLNLEQQYQEEQHSIEQLEFQSQR